MKIKMKAILVSPPQKQLLHIPLRLCLTRFSKQQLVQCQVFAGYFPIS